MSVISYYNDTYGFTSYLIICPKADFIKEAIKAPVNLSENDAKEFVDNIDDSYAGYTVPLTADGVDSYFIWLPEFTESVNSIMYLSHETSHVSFKALLHRGWVDFENETVQHSYMYLKDAIFKHYLSEIQKNLEKKEKRPKKKKK